MQYELLCKHLYIIFLKHIYRHTINLNYKLKYVQLWQKTLTRTNNLRKKLSLKKTTRTGNKSQPTGASVYCGQESVPELLSASKPCETAARAVSNNKRLPVRVAP